MGGGGNVVEVRALVQPSTTSSLKHEGRAEDVEASMPSWGVSLFTEQNILISGLGGQIY